MAFTPWMTSQNLIDSVKRKIAVPISQNTFSENDILAFANEEMFISQVPSVLQFHEEYFVTYKTVPLQTNVSRYAIPDRATGMKLRDLFWQDQNGNLFEMTRIEEHDKAFFQANVGANQAVHKFYVEGNDVVLTPSVVDSPTGFLIMVFFLRPNQLVKNDRAATIECFNQTIKINNSLISPLDIININPINLLTGPAGGNVPSGIIPFTAVNAAGGSITDIEIYSNEYTQVTSVNHQLSTNQTVVITGSNSNPSIDGTYLIQVIDPDNFIIPIQIATSGNAGTFTSPNQFLIGVSASATASNLADAINATEIIKLATASLDTVILCYENIYMTIVPTNTVAFVVPSKTIGIQFESLPLNYTDQETNIIEPLFQDGTVIDILKTKPGHTTYVYDIKIPRNGISGTSITFPMNALLVPTGTVNNSAGSTGAPSSENSVQFILAPIQVGDYICLANESIIPQIPPDLHNGLAERTSARILASLGDTQGLQASMQKIQEIDARQGNLLDNRVEGTPQKVTGRHSLLRYGRFGVRRRL